MRKKTHIGVARSVTQINWGLEYLIEPCLWDQSNHHFEKIWSNFRKCMCQLWLFESVTHVARHMVATTIALNNGITKEVIAKILGHSSTKETRIYAIVEKQLIGQAMGKLMEPVGVN